MSYYRVPIDFVVQADDDDACYRQMMDFLRGAMSSYAAQYNIADWEAPNEYPTEPCDHNVH